MLEAQLTPVSDSDRDRGNVGAVPDIEPMDVIDPFGPALGGGDCVARSAVLSIEPLLAEDVGVPSEVWRLRPAGGSPEAPATDCGLPLRLLKRNAMLDVDWIEEEVGSKVYDQTFAMRQVMPQIFVRRWKGWRVKTPE
jgi:hypothetical protein